ncbi:ApbE family protein [Limosilactobacillus coleohominis 101-4-CHN]|uniref:FAD:protein FMN transferase n=2 Tax=Limosilactobacillus coleohominis TaxID=181675 RepID=C7XUD7_9LACO|nr:ApbE family protein [Limosilactobacillus coleohominis 101-4-CHN]
MMSVERSIHLMGTIIKLQLQTPVPNAEQIADESVRRLQKYEQIFSANDDSSALMKVNQQAGKSAVKVPAELFNLIKIGKQYSLYPGGFLNIAIGPLVKLWHIGFADAHVPDTMAIQERLALTDPRLIKLDEQQQTVMLARPGMEIDLGALAKGYSADLIKEFLVHAGVTSAVINLGGNVVVIGGNQQRSDGMWHVGLQDPQQALGNYVDVLKLNNQSIVTSGIYERNLTSHGHFYHHIFNPKTGYPIQTDMASLSIISPKSFDGEIWTSMLFGQDWSYIQQVIKTLENVQAIVINRDGQMLTCE